MECAKIRELIGPYLDNELSADELSRVKAHLADCADCRRELAELEQVKGLVKSLPRHPAPKTLVERIEQLNKPVQASLLLRYRWVIPSLATAAAAVLVVYVSIISLPHYQSKAARPPASEVVAIAPAAPPAKPAPKETIGLEYDRLSKDGAEGRIAKKGGDIETAPNDSIANAPEEMRHKEARVGKGGGWGEGAAEQGLRQQAVLDDKSTVKAQTATAPQVTQRDEKKESEKEDYADEVTGNMQFGAKQKTLSQPKEPAQPPSAASPERNKTLAAGETSAKSAAKKDRAVIRSFKTADTVAWQTGSLQDIINQAGDAEQLALVYFYFSNKDTFPQNYNEKLMQYSQERAVFTRIFVPTDETGKITDPGTEALFKRHKLPNSAQCVIFDYYGNLIHIVPKPLGTNKIAAAIDEATKKAASLESALDKYYTRAERLGQEGKIPEQIKSLQSIINTGYNGYPPVVKAQNKLSVLNQQAITAQNDILKNYMEVPADRQAPDKALEELELIQRNYRGLPAEKEIEQNKRRVQDSQTPAKK